MRIASQLLASLRLAPAAVQLSAIMVFVAMLTAGRNHAAESPEGSSSRSSRKEAVRSVPFQKLNPSVSGQVREVLNNPSYYRRMPSQVVQCDPKMFTFLVRRPEVMVNIWQIMGITNVTAKRLNTYSFYANDGVGTTCRCDLIYADSNMHIYMGDGTYDGSLAPRKVTGRCVCILRSDAKANASGESFVQGTMDVFLKLDNLGADLLARSVGPFVSKTADYNFLETAKFISQISQVCERSPSGAQSLAMKLENCDQSVRREFAMLAEHIGQSKYLSIQRQDARGWIDPPNPGHGLATAQSNASHESSRSQSSSDQTPQAGPQVIHITDRQGESIAGPASQNPANPSSDYKQRADSWQPARKQNQGDQQQGRSRLIAPQKQEIFMRR